MASVPTIRRARTAAALSLTVVLGVWLLLAASCSGPLGDTPSILARPGTGGDGSTLTGATVSGVIVIYVEAKPSYQSVSFYLDDPTLQGPPLFVDASVPYELDLDTTGLPDGDHTVTAIVLVGRGGNNTKVVAQATFTVANGTPVTNLAPVVDAGADATIELGQVADLAGSVTDDGLPTPQVGVAWSKVSGPGSATFADANAATTTVGFSQAGTYDLRLTASDGSLTGSDDLTVTVQESATGGGGGTTTDVQVFYYPWYGNPTFDLGTSGTNASGWRHWQQNGHTPPDDLGASYYPQLGPYSASSSGTLDQHMQWIADAGIGVVIASWWGQGSWEDQHLPALLSAADAHGLKVAIHLEPYGGRTPSSVLADIAYLYAHYGSSPALFRVARATGPDASTAPRAVVYVFDVLASGTLTQWKSAMDSLHGSADDAFVLGQRVSTNPIVDAHFDGVYTYDAYAVDPTSFVSYAPVIAGANGVFAPSVGPGYDERRAVAGSTRYVSRSGGQRYDAFWQNAIQSGAPWITITSFNEWHEGTQIEPAVAKNLSGYTYSDYVGDYGTSAADAPMAYLDRTRHWVDAFLAQTPPPPPPTGGTTVTIAAAGDIACDPASGSYNGGAGTSSSCHMLATSDLLLGADPDAVLTLGDNQYEQGTLSAYQTSYDASWGRLKAITKPAPGNHEYLTDGATGYYAYFGAAAGDPSKGYYAYDLGSWHLVAINSDCSKVGGCGPGSPQETWLRADLAAHAGACTLAYWHHPRYSSGEHGDNTSMKAIWQALVDYDAEVVLSGHDHDYERFAPQDANGNADAAHGVVQFVVGTGGKNHYPIASAQANSVVRNDDTFGVLTMTLSPTGYSWRFAAEPGKTFSDSGSAACH